jgi:HEAT repeat protein
MTHAGTCEERSRAAEALGSVHNRKAAAALKKLAGSSFKDESPSPGIFSCSSRRAAQRALEQQGT